MKILLENKNTAIFGIAALVWATWFALLGFQPALNHVVENWQITVTMIFGSMIAGATSIGGGAVAFPVFTKLLQIPPYDAKVFSLAIQSVGMGAATLAIILTRIQVEWRVILWGSIGGVFGVWFGLTQLAPLLPPPAIKMSFTMMLTSFAITLVILNRTGLPHRHESMPKWTMHEKTVILLAGLLGGMMSGLVGNGIDIFVFAAMVLLFRMCEKVSTPTSVVLMAFNAMAGFAIQAFVINDFTPPAMHYWYAAIPVVVVGAPLGAMFCNSLSRETIANILIGLIFIEFLTSLILIPLNSLVIYSSLSILVVFSMINYLMYRTRTYEQLPVST
ncbi:sulfite exporter TauE/SafE family protein [Candidatus Albibeggiatoa sp. nov. NOAA]|uniref:sulfite exporter TauE/SafE family protein n=1 Tax=Candidatus Albibeggiatoa sp. nov. NOAA TaxID=3162724 RepID=UPI0032F2988A|nr:sulfite exporter TauE/SafE family protein [Thiotrichaceae bacterium]